MQHISVDDLQKLAKMLSVSLSEERLKVLAPLLNQTLEGLQPLVNLSLPKELETTTYLALIKEIGRKGHAESL